MSNINFFRMMAGNGSQFNSQVIPCDSSGVNFTGNDGEYYAQSIVLGTGIGPITASFNAQSVPDRFLLEWSGSVVADSLFVGDSLKNSGFYNGYTASAISTTSLVRYDYNYTTDVWATGSSQSVSFNSSSFPPFGDDGGAFLRGNSQVLNASGKGNWGAQKGVLNDFPGANNASVEGNVKLCFFKHSTLPSEFTLRSTGFDTNTAWDLFGISCPTGTELNSSSIQNPVDLNKVVVYHTSPTFDFQVGQTLYKDSALTIPFDVNQATNFHGENCMIMSGSLTTNPSSTGDWENQCFKNPAGSNTGYSYMTFNSDLAQIGSLFCSGSEITPPATYTPFLVGNPSAFVADMCDQLSSSNTYYHNGSGTYPAVGDIVYLDSSGTTPFNGGTGINVPWFPPGANPPGGWFRILGSAGGVFSTSICP